MAIPQDKIVDAVDASVNDVSIAPESSTTELFIQDYV